jgi:adenylosuccinate synthase
LPELFICFPAINAINSIRFAIITKERSVIPATVIVGGQWGDEGKAKIVDFLMPGHDVVIRYQGGANAGHTVVNQDGRFAFHQIPSGILYPHVTGILGNGMVVDPFAFLDELRELMQRGMDVNERIRISSAAQVVMPYHRMLDNLYETDLKGASIGSTGKGIGPAYADKHMRSGLRMGIFLREKGELFDVVKTRTEWSNRLLGLFGAPPLSAEKVASDFVNIKELISGFVVDTQELVHRMLAEGKRILLEGAQGTLLDVDHGTYPFVTSSSCTVGGAVIGSGLAPRNIGSVMGIFKSYITRVGNGPMPTELTGADGNKLRERGNEYGTTTGRPRRCGWFDLVAGRYSVLLNGYDEIALTKLDVISGLPKVRVCTAYDMDGKRITSFPQSFEDLARCTPVYEELPGWEEKGIKAESYEGLPANARRFLERIEQGIGVRISFISTGAAREETIVRSAAYSFDKK